MPATVQQIENLRDRLAAATSDPPPGDPTLGGDVARLLGIRLSGDPASSIAAAAQLCGALGLACVHEQDSLHPVMGRLERVPADLVLVKHERTAEPSGHHIHDRNDRERATALALCRGVIAQIWLTHPGREQHYADLHQRLGQHQS